MHSGVSGAGGQRAFAKNELRLDLSMDKKKYGNQQWNGNLQKTMHSEVSGAGGQRAFAKNAHRLDVGMDKKMYGNQEWNVCMYVSIYVRMYACM